MSAQQMTDRRQHPRFALQPMFNAVSLSLDEQSTASPALSGHVYDVSESGFRVEVDEAIKPGTAVTFALDLNGADETVCGRGTVAWGYFDPIEPRTRRLALRVDAFVSDEDRARYRNLLRAAPLRKAA